jgi:hypothetical protein
MTPLRVGALAVRVWRQESMERYRGDPFPHFDKSELMRLERDLNREGRSDPVAIAELFIALPRVNAVEVLDPEKHGVVLYRDWP